jgi:hypothetical protein
MKLLSGAVALACLSMLGVAGTASAAETIYWDNYAASPTTIGFASIDGSGGGVLGNASVAKPGTEVELRSPEGLAYDPANGRIYVANSDNDEITWVATDGSGAGVLDTGAAPVESPAGIAVDPATQTVYWANDVGSGSIGYASAAGGTGGKLNTTGATIDEPYKVALDTVNGRIYWISGSADTISSASLTGAGGADLKLPEGERLREWTAINVDPATNRLYVVGENEAEVEGIIWVSTVGLGGGAVELGPPSFDRVFGLALDPPSGRFYWANFGAGEDRANAFGTLTMTSQPKSIGIATAPLDGPQDLVIVKSPVGVAAPKVTGSDGALSCSPGDWEPDYPGSYVYAAPLSFAYQWSKDGAPIAGATASTYLATASGSYSCAVTAANLSGATSQASAGFPVRVAERKTDPAKPAPSKPAPTPAVVSAKAASKKAIKVKAGGIATVPVTLTNGGGSASGAVKVCAKLGKQALKGLVAPKCFTAGSVPANGRANANLRVKARGTAKGAYKVGVTVNGAPAMTVKVKVVAAAPKHHHRT